jgi:D-lactate dehydrogenase (cytochrome)
MATHHIRARAPRGASKRPAVLTGDDVLVYVQDAARTIGGHAPAVALPRSEAEVAYVLREAASVLPVGAQSSLTGGATPFGEWVLSLARMDEILALSSDRVRGQAGIALSSLQELLHPRGLFYPPAPTFRGALLGGTAATNAAGAATFKYGSTREWVRALTVVLACGDVLDIERGAVRAHLEGFFEIELTSGETRRVPVPGYDMPAVAKRSAGYHAEPNMDLVDLFVGSEGTLGVITEVEVGVLPEPVRLLGWASFESEGEALRAVGRIREASRETWTSRDARGIDVASIESMDRRCLQLLREDGKDREHRLRLDPLADTAVLFALELPAGTDASGAVDELGAFDEGERRDGPLPRLCSILRDHGAFDSLEAALPGDARRAADLEAMREAVPLGVNHRIEALQRGGHPSVHKVAGDMIVPFARLPEMLACYRDGFTRRGLDHAIFGHVSDGNLHANAIPRSADDVRLAEDAILELGRKSISLGGCPLSEHGVGRNPVKQRLLRLLYGEEGVAAMRRVKRALDPEGRLAPGVVFTRPEDAP